jgi:hypothetical protein
LPDGYEKIPADYVIPDANDTLTTYSQKIISQYNMQEGAIVGVIRWAG